MKRSTRRIRETLEVTSEGAFAGNYDQVSPDATVALRVSCSPSMIGFGLAAVYLSHGTLLYCPLSTGLDFALSHIVLPISAPYHPFLCGYLLLTLYMLIDFHFLHQLPPLLYPTTGSGK